MMFRAGSPRPDAEDHATVEKYLLAQVEAGAEAVQLFDSGRRAARAITAPSRPVARIIKR
jgi:hypothetical protein